jgi:hypothetical protein
METLVTALGPVFAAGLAIQQLLELLDSILLKKFIGDDYKKAVLGLLSLIAGLALAFGAGLRVLELLGVSSPWYWDEITTGLIISGGTQGINSILKFLGYAKEGKKADAVAKVGAVKAHVKSFAEKV